MTVKERFKGIIDYFLEAMPEAATELHYSDPYQLLVAVILSAQCTDKRVNMITPPLFEAFPTPQAMAQASPEEIYQYIKSVSYPNNKTKSLLGMAKVLVEKYDGKVPSSIDELLTIPGVGRKTANVILAVVYDKPAMAVDTHVFRVSERIGLTTDSRSPLQTEQQLMKYIPEELVTRAHHWLILHGRYVCKARRPDCMECGIRAYCRHYNSSEK
ncbi:MAG: endonuclease III [Candidatus Amulumruptor caecigallinarius]|uniref:Endonuclease III n=1 Tax=Candidatus Amulumruptor caecigallinarius TaxID=2109911 RepID=A0A4Q0U8K2_9BACT|nr:MAG: endonuclease III [Candidatus Amulumruptor caecigallinarius]HJE39174.1 endonuclease III [Candidatus Amulumruptor caecigallinarius]